MKTCSKCKQELLLTEFGKNKSRIDGYEYWCKPCKKNTLNNSVNQFHKSLKLNYNIVYLLPDHNYVGITNRPYIRMAWHRSQCNRNTDNWIELARFDIREEALKCEAEYHAKGFEGGK